MNDIYLLLGWGSPIGTGLFLVFLGTFIYLLARAAKTDKETKKK